MIRLLTIGFWVCLVTLASAYAGVYWRTSARAPQPEAAKHSGGVETVRTKMLSVPIIADGAIQGYVMAQFVLTVDSKVTKSLSVKPDVFFRDEAYRAIFAGTNVDFRNFKKQDLAGLAKQIAQGVNDRVGVRVIEDVLVQELNYVPKSAIRGGLKP
jgi:hypothetical protein